MMQNLIENRKACQRKQSKSWNFCLSSENRAKGLVVIEVFIERKIRCIVRFVLATAGVNHHVCLWNPYVISKPVGVSSVFQRIPDVRPNPPLKGKREGLEKAACDMTSLLQEDIQ